MRRQRQRGVGALEVVGQPLGDRPDLAVVGAAQAEQADLLVAGRLDALQHHLADALDRPLAHRPGDHARLAEPAAARAPAEDLDAVALVDRLGQRHQGLLRVRPLVEVHDRVLGDAVRDPVPVGRHPLDAAVGQVVDVVKPWYVDISGLGEPEQQLLATARAALGLEGAGDGGDVENCLLAVAENCGVDEVGDRLGVEGAVPADEDDRVVVRPWPGVERDAGEVERVEHVGVAQLGAEADAEDVERPDRPVRVDGELRHLVLAHQRLEVGPHRVGALGQDVGLLVEHLVQDHDALVGQADLVRVRVHQAPADVGLVPVLDGRVQLTADVLDRLLHLGQQGLQAGEQRLDRHGTQPYAAPTLPRLRHQRRISAVQTRRSGLHRPRSPRRQRVADGGEDLRGSVHEVVPGEPQDQPTVGEERVLPAPIVQDGVRRAVEGPPVELDPDPPTALAEVNPVREPADRDDDLQLRRRQAHPRAATRRKRDSKAESLPGVGQPHHASQPIRTGPAGPGGSHRCQLLLVARRRRRARVAVRPAAANRCSDRRCLQCPARRCRRQPPRLLGLQSHRARHCGAPPADPCCGGHWRWVPSARPVPDQECPPAGTSGLPTGDSPRHPWVRRARPLGRWSTHHRRRLRIDEVDGGLHAHPCARPHAAPDRRLGRRRASRSCGGQDTVGG